MSVSLELCLLYVYESINNSALFALNLCNAYNYYVMYIFSGQGAIEHEEGN